MPDHLTLVSDVRPESSPTPPGGTGATRRAGASPSRLRDVDSPGADPGGSGAAGAGLAGAAPVGADRANGAAADALGVDVPAVDVPGVDALDDGALEELVVGEAGRIAAATCAWLLHLGEFDRRSAWSHSYGVRSTAHWLSWRCGIGSGTAAEQVRVARALRRMPATVAQFAAGRLSYSQVRAVTRAVDEVGEDTLLDLAVQCTGAQVERLVAGLRRSLRPQEESARHRAREARWYVDTDGMVVLRARLAGEEGALVVAALDAAYATAAQAPDPAEPGEEADGTDRRGERAVRSRADAVVALAQAYADAVARADGVDPTGDRAPVQVVLHADLDALAEAAAWTPAPPTGSTANAAATADVPDPAAAAITGPAVAQGAATNHDPAGPSCAGHDAAGHGPAGHGPAGHAPAGGDAESPKRSSAEDQQRRGRSAFDIGLGAHPVLLARVLCDRQIRLVAELGDGRGIDLGRTRRRTTARQRAVVLRRDGGACRYPGCAARRHLHLHHVRHWIHGGTTDSDNLITLCGFHHRRLHEQAYSIAIPDPGRFTFWLPDGRPLPEHPPVQPTPGAPPLTRDDSLHPAADELRKAAARYARGQRLHLNAAVGALLGA